MYNIKKNRHKAVEGLNWKHVQTKDKFYNSLIKKCNKLQNEVLELLSHREK